MLSRKQQLVAQRPLFEEQKRYSSRFGRRTALVAYIACFVFARSRDGHYSEHKSQPGLWLGGAHGLGSARMVLLNGGARSRRMEFRSNRSSGQESPILLFLRERKSGTGYRGSGHASRNVSHCRVAGEGASRRIRHACATQIN